MSTRHLPTAIAVMFVICCPKESVRSNVTPRSFGRGVKRSGWPSRWIVGCHRVLCRLLVKNDTVVSVERHLVRSAPLRDACDGVFHGSLGGQLAKMTAEQGHFICKHCGFDAVWYNGLQIVDIE